MGYKVLTDYSFTIERETTFGTKIDASPIGLPTEKMDFVQEPNKHEFKRSWGYRGTHQANYWQDTFGVIPTAQVSMIMTPQLMSTIMPGILQNSTDWSGTGASSAIYTIYANNYSNLPSPKTTGDGYFFTLTRNSPDAGNDEHIISALPKSCKLSIGATDNEGVLMGDFEFLGTEYQREQSATGTITHASLSGLFKWGEISAVTFGAIDLTSDFVSAEVNITNGAKLVSDIPDGEYVFPMWEVEWTVKVIANAYTEDIKDAIMSSDVNSASALSVVFGSDTCASAGDLVIQSMAYATEYSSSYEEGEVIDFKFKGVFTTTNYPIKMIFNKG